MSFYGDISNAAKNKIDFDKIYPNRKLMDDSAKFDGVFVGRYVLIEYDDNTHSYRQGYLMFKPDITKEKNNNLPVYKVYADETLTQPYMLSKNNVASGYGIAPGDIVFAVHGNSTYHFECTEKAQGDGSASFVLLSVGSNDYTINYSIDKSHYEAILKMDFPIRGYDSTIWQKVVNNGNVMYRKIADLNSVTPTFQLEPEAPSIVPIAPHFGNNSTNIDYTLHIQPNWGFRVKEELDPDLSDSKVVYKTVELNEETGLEEEVPKDYNGAIYYNKAGFSREFISHSDEANEFSILPTGISGKKYVKHENPRFNDVEYEERPDIQEITVKLPEIGNIMANVWDLMYGGYELNNSTERNLNIEWDNTIGLRMFETDPTGNGFSFNKSKGATVAGCINSVHDLMGMIISEPMEDTSTVEGIQKALDAATTGKIYFGALTPNSDKRGYYFKDKAFKFTSFEDKKKEDPDFNEVTYRGGRKYYVLNQFEPKQYFTYSDKNFYLESADLPTEDTLYYKLGNPVPVKVKQWQPIIEVTNPETGAVEKQTVYSYYIDDNFNYIKDIDTRPDPYKTYYSIETKAATRPTANGSQKPLYIWSPKDPVVLANIDESPDLFAEISQGINSDDMRKNNIIEFRSGYFRLITEEVEGKIENKALVEATTTQNNEYDQYSRYYYIPKYAVALGQNEQGETVPILYFVHNGELISFIKAIEDENDSKGLYTPLEVKFIPFTENTYYIPYPEDSAVKGWECVQYSNQIDKEVVYYTITATPETGNLTEEGGDGEVFITHFYQPYRFFFISDTDDYILDTRTKPTYDQYYYLTDKYNNLLEYAKNGDGLLVVTPEDVDFYYPNKYYYRDKDTKEDTLDDSITMKKPGDSVVDPNYVDDKANPKTVYYIPNEVYVVDDPKKILSVGSIWDKNDNPPDGVVLGIREDTFKWTELTGFARTLNTINGLILYLNKFFKFGDTETRDENTVQGCLNKLKDIMNAFDTLELGDVLVVDEYGRISSSDLVGDAWLNAYTTKNINETSINVRHNTPQAVTTEKGQTEDDSVLLGDSFTVLRAGLDEKGHVASLTEKTITLPTLSVSDESTKQIVTDIELSANKKTLTISRENVGEFTLDGYDYDKGSVAKVSNEDSVNTAFAKLQNSLDDEVSNRKAAIEALDMTANESATQFITKIEEVNGIISVTRADGGTLVLGPYSKATTAQDINATDSIKQALGKLEYKLNVLNGDSSVNGSVAYQIAEIVAGADASYDTLKEIADWILNDTTGAASMQSDIGNLQKLVGEDSVKDQIDQAIAAALSGEESGTQKYALSGDLDNAEDRIKDLEDIVTTEAVQNWNTQADWTETNESSIAFIKNKPTNLVTTETLFTYGEGETATQKTIAELFTYIATLEAKIATLEGHHPTGDDEGTAT